MISEATKLLLLSVSNAFSGFTDKDGDLNAKGLIILCPFAVMAVLIILSLDGPAL